MYATVLLSAGKWHCRKIYESYCMYCLALHSESLRAPSWCILGSVGKFSSPYRFILKDEPCLHFEAILQVAGSYVNRHAAYLPGLDREELR